MPKFLVTASRHITFGLTEEVEAVDAEAAEKLLVEKLGAIELSSGTYEVDSDEIIIDENEEVTQKDDEEEKEGIRFDG